MFEIEILSNLLHSILDLFTKFQTNLLELFSRKVDISSKSESMRSIQQTPTRIQTGNDESNRIIERFKQIVHKEPEIIEDDTPFYKDKNTYIAGAAILLLLGLGYYYFDDLKPIGTSLLAWINANRPRPGNDPMTPGGNIQESSKSTIQMIKDSLSKRFFGKDESPSKGSSPAGDSIQLGPETKGKTIDFNNLTQS
jgi:hypothetical protein